MSDEIWTRAEIESPCVKLCTIHPKEQICVGCLRTIDEIMDWSKMTPEARRSVMAELPTRAPRIATRRGGRRARVRSAN